jgi:hypothetical protein
MSGRVYVYGCSFSTIVSIKSWVVFMDKYFHPLYDGATPDLVILYPCRYFPPFLFLG